MSCYLTSGYKKGCDIPGGYRRLIFINKDHVTITRDPNNIASVSAITLSANTSGFIYDVENEVTDVTQKTIGTAANNSHAYEIQLKTKLHGFSNILQKQIDDMSKSRIVVIAETNNGVYQVLFDEAGVKPSIELIYSNEYNGFVGYNIEMSLKTILPIATVDASIVNSLSLTY